jgi:Protein of unknown function (DUF2442)
MFKVKEAKPLPGYRLWLKFTDDVTGEVDLSDMVGSGVFAIWNRPGAFESVQVNERGHVNWGPDIDLCSDALYLEVTGLSPADIFPGLTESSASHARN